MAVELPEELGCGLQDIERTAHPTTAPIENVHNKSWLSGHPYDPVVPGSFGYRTLLPEGAWRTSVDYAELGIVGTMPSSGLCRVIT